MPGSWHFPSPCLCSFSPSCTGGSCWLPTRAWRRPSAGPATRTTTEPGTTSTLCSALCLACGRCVRPRWTPFSRRRGARTCTSDPCAMFGRQLRQPVLLLDYPPWKAMVQLNGGGWRSQLPMQWMGRCGGGVQVCSQLTPQLPAQAAKLHRMCLRLSRSGQGCLGGGRMWRRGGALSHTPASSCGTKPCNSTTSGGGGGHVGTTLQIPLSRPLGMAPSDAARSCRLQCLSFCTRAFGNALPQVHSGTERATCPASPANNFRQGKGLCRLCSLRRLQPLRDERRALRQLPTQQNPPQTRTPRHPKACVRENGGRCKPAGKLVRQQQHPHAPC